MTRAIIAALVFSSAPALGQVFFQNGQQHDPTAAYKKQLERRIATVIDDIHRTCKLSDKQLAKLRLAGKGAIASSMEAHKKQLNAMRNQIGILDPFGGEVPEPAVDDDDDEGEEAAEEATEETDEDDGGDEDAQEEGEQAEAVFNAVAQALEVRGGNAWMPAFGARPINVTKEQRWIRALSSVLTKEQKAAYDTAVANRRAFLRSTAVGAFIAKVDRKLLLAGDQRHKLTLLVDREVGEPLLKQADQAQNMNQWVVFGGAVGGLAEPKPPIPHKELKEILSKVQFEEWTSSFEGELTMLRSQFNGNAANVAPGVFRMQFAR